MENHCLDAVPFQINVNQLLKRLHIDEKNDYARDVRRLAGEAQAIARPKGFYKVASIESRGDDYVVIEGVKLRSRVLRVNLEKAYRVFPFVATCGVELEDWSRSIVDELHRYWADTIKEMALSSALRATEEHLMQRYRPGPTSVMKPGEIADWPIAQQRNLFAILGSPEDSVGVHLTDSFLMIPIKSVSGMRFPTETHFESCQLCPMEKCPGRRAPYDSLLYERRYR